MKPWELAMEGKVHGEKTTRKRLDQEMVERGLLESLEKAQALIMAGRVKVEGKPATKPGQRVRPEEAISLEPGADYF